MLPPTLRNFRTIANYLRVSTEDQAREGYSLGNQEEANLAFIAQRFGSQVKVVIYSDVESGFSIERKNYLKLIEDCRQGKIDAVVVWRIDRFTRNTSAGLATLTNLTVNSGIPVFSVSEGEINFNDPNNKLVNTFLVGIAEYERNRLQQRVMPGMIKGTKMGHYQGTRHVIWGARYDKPNKRLEWIEGEIKAIKVLFSRVAGGDSIHSVTRYLYEQGFRNRYGKPLTITLLCNAIKRKIYADGIYRWNGVESENKILEPFIDLGIWEQANQTVGTHRSKTGPGRKSPRDDSHYVLQGALKCRFCGANLVGHTARLGVRYYVCSTYFSKTKAACRGQWIKADPVEAQALNILRTAVSNKVILDFAKEELKKSMGDRNPEMMMGIRLAEKHLRELDAKHKRLLDLYYQVALSVDQFKNENNAILSERQVIQQSLDQLKSKLNTFQMQAANVSKIFDILENFDTIYVKLDPKAKKNLYNWVFKFAHAKCLGRRKPKYIDNYELNEPFDLLLSAQKGGEQENVWKIQRGISNIQLSPMAAK